MSRPVRQGSGWRGGSIACATGCGCTREQAKVVKAVVFVLDGTLIDSAEDLCGALNRLLAAEGLHQLALPEVVPMIGDGAAKLVERGFGAAGSSSRNPPTP